VHVDGAATRTCITTVEAAVQKASPELEVEQCGYCRSGQIMSAAALLKDMPKPADDDIDAAMNETILLVRR
jgi:isoquinoline 1-oxidoreductase subunit alpha